MRVGRGGEKVILASEGSVGRGLLMPALEGLGRARFWARIAGTSPSDSVPLLQELELRVAGRCGGAREEVEEGSTAFRFPNWAEEIVQFLQLQSGASTAKYAILKFSYMYSIVDIADQLEGSRDPRQWALG